MDVPDYNVGPGLLWASLVSDGWGAGVRRLQISFPPLSAWEAGASLTSSHSLPSKALAVVS